jgi:hypothetical protein
MKKIQLFIISISFIFFNSCSKEEIVPPPEAFFSMNLDYSDLRTAFIANYTEEVTFTSTSKNATLIEWEFGDGTFATGTSVTHVYEEKGSYTVRMIANNEGSVFSSLEKNISVGGRILKSISILKIDDKDSNGQSWDERNGNPDILFFFGEVDNPDFNFLVAFPDNLNAHVFPFGGLTSFNPEFTDKEWFWIIIDNDAPMDEFDLNDDYMFGTKFNPMRIGSRDMEVLNGDGFIKVISGLDDSGNEVTSKFSISIGWTFVTI